jgi:hypothetical protein
MRIVGLDRLSPPNHRNNHHPNAVLIFLCGAAGILTMLMRDGLASYWLGLLLALKKKRGRLFIFFPPDLRQTLCNAFFFFIISFH